MARPCAAPPPQPSLFAQARERRRLPIGRVLVAASSATRMVAGVETAHGFIFVPVFDYLQSERVKHRYKILTSWREAGFLLTSGSCPPSSSPFPSSLSLSSSSTTQDATACPPQSSFRSPQICDTLPCSSAWSRGPRDFTIFDARPAPSRTCGVPPAPGHHRTGRGAPVLWSDFLPVGRAGQLSTQVPILRRFPRPPPVLPLACLLPGSVEIDRGFSPPRNPGMPGLLLFWAAGHSLPGLPPPRSAVTYPTQEVA